MASCIRAAPRGSGGTSVNYFSVRTTLTTYVKRYTSGHREADRLDRNVLTRSSASNVDRAH